MPVEAQTQKDSSVSVSRWDDANAARWDADFKVVDIPSKTGGDPQKAYIYKASEAKRPLIVSLHTWSGDYRQADPLAAEAKAKEESTSSQTAAQRMAELAEKENTIALQKREIEELRSSLQTQSQAAETVEANYREELLKHSQDLQAWREKEKEATRVQTELAETREKMETLAKEKTEREKAEEESEKVGDRGRSEA